MSQSAYISTIKLFLEDGSFEQFKSVRSAFLWACQARPDIARAANWATQATKEAEFEVRLDYVKLLKSDINPVRKEPLPIMFHKIHKSSVHLGVYVDASFGSKMDLSSQLGYIMLLCDSTNRSHILDFASQKCKRVTRSTLGGEFYATTEGFDCAFMIRHVSVFREMNADVHGMEYALNI